MLAKRIVPLIVAVALFMENMDSTVIATSLPAIAADIGTSPLTLKLAVTSYLLSLAVFIPVSGWTADRFGARTVFRGAIAVFMLGSIGCALSGSLSEFVVARIVEGMGGDDDPGRAPHSRAQRRPARADQRHGLGDPAGADRAADRPGPRRLHHHLHFLAPDFSDQHPDRACRHRLGDDLHRGRAGADAGPVRSARRGARRAGHRRARLRRLLARAQFPPTSVVLALIVMGAGAAYASVLHARRTPAPVLDLSLLEIPTMRAAVVGGFIYRSGIGAMPFLLPLLLQLGFNLTAFQSGLITLSNVVGAMGMKTVIPFILRRFGFRRVLVVNALISAVLVATCATFTPGVSFAWIVGVLIVGGFFRSLEFTSLNTIAYADVDNRRMSRPPSLVAVAQQVSISVGVAIGALAVDLTLWARGRDTITAADFQPAYLAIAVIAGCACFVFARMPADAGAELARRSTAPPAGPTEATGQRMGWRVAGGGVGLLGAEPRRQQIKLRRIRPARGRLHVPHMGEIALERREQRRLGAALQHLAEKRAAGGKRFAREVDRGFCERHDLEMVGPAVAGRIRRHVGEHDGGGGSRPGPYLIRCARIEKVALDEFDARYGRHLKAIDRHDFSPPLHAVPPPLHAADALHRDLAPAARRGAEIDHACALLEQMVLVVDLDQFEGGAGGKTLALGARHVRVVELPFKPALRRRRTAATRFDADLERALAGLRTHFDPTFGSDTAPYSRRSQVGRRPVAAPHPILAHHLYQHAFAQSAVGHPQPLTREGAADGVENGATGKHEVGPLGTDASIGHAIFVAPGQQAFDHARHLIIDHPAALHPPTLATPHL